MLQFFRKVIHRWMLRPLVAALWRSRVAGRRRLDIRGPAIVVANHNSHVDTVVLLAAFPTEAIPRVRPVAAADYFLRTRILSWFTTRIVGILAIDRRGAAGRGGQSPSDPLAGADAALGNGEVLVLFPEGSRGEPGRFGPLKSGVARLAERHPTVPVIPVWLDGCDLALPKGRRIPRPVRTRVLVGPAVPIEPGEDHETYLHRLRSAMLALSADAREAA